MAEVPQHLNNMSGASRSSVTVQPRRVDPPTVAHGAKVRSKVGVHISLAQAIIRYCSSQLQASSGAKIAQTVLRDESQCIPGLYRLLVLKQWDAKRSLPDMSECEDTLRDLADRAIIEQHISGCVILHIKPEGSYTKQNLSSLGLVFAILAKSSDRLFVASKTPNLSLHLLQREVVTFDPRIISLLEVHA